LLPLKEEPVAVRVLILNDRDNFNLALPPQFLGCFVPHGHVLSAA
jgi:hypothetical protein